MGIDFRDVSGNTALYIALQSGFRERVQLLLIEGADISERGNVCQVLLQTTLPILEDILEDCLMIIDVPVNSIWNSGCISIYL